MTKWTRNQMIMMGTMIIALFALLIQGYQIFNLSKDQQEIKVDLNEVKGKVGNFEKIVTEEIIIGNSSSIKHDGKKLSIKVN